MRREDLLHLRHSTYLIMCASAGSKQVGKMENHWPLGEPKQIEPMSEERRRAIFERYKIRR